VPGQAARPRTIEVVDEQLRVTLEHRVTIHEQLLQALHQDQFRVVYQPIADANGLVVAGFEALVRWDHPTGGMISRPNSSPWPRRPAHRALGARVLRATCRQAAAW